MRVLTVGRPRPSWAEQMEAYRVRAQGAWAWEHRVVAAARGKEPEAARRRREGDLLLAELTPQEFVIALDEHGEELDSIALARRLAQYRDRGRPLALVIGGADGLDSRVLERADWAWSLSRLTWPHELAAVMVAEQLYRAQSLTEGHPYHRA